MKKLYYNADIITMENEEEIANAMLLDGDKICSVGSYDQLKDEAQERIDLGGKTVLPGFFDAHGHFMITAFAKSYFVDISCTPENGVDSVEKAIDRLREYGEKNPGNDPIVGFGFDDTLTDDFVMPQAADLDMVSTNRWVIVLHMSMHILSANTKAMEDTGVFCRDFNPEGGKVRRKNGRPTGVFEEMPAMGEFMKKIFSPDMMKEMGNGIENVAYEYIRNGVCTMCEGAGSNNMAEMIEMLQKSGKFKGRYIICPSYAKGVPEKYPSKDPLKIINGPVKLICDGSIQNYTAYMKEPYYKPHPSGEDRELCGFPHMNQEELEKKISEISCSGRYFAIHANGDSAIEMVITAVEKCREKGHIKKGHNLIIHCQTVHENQLKRMKVEELYPSFFPVHIYIYGDRHRDIFLGKERSQRINPIKDAVQIGNVFSLHSDSPVFFCRPLWLVWCAVKRETSGKKILGKDQRIGVYEALKGITVNAAKSYGVEESLGSLAPGKKADFVVLNQNPLKVDVNDILNISVEKVFIDGEEII